MSIDVDDIYDSDFDDSDFEDLVHSGKDIQVIYFDNIEQFQHSEKKLNKIGWFNHNSNIVQYIIIKPGKQLRTYISSFSHFFIMTFSTYSFVFNIIIRIYYIFTFTTLFYCIFNRFFFNNIVFCLIIWEHVS